MLALFTAAFLFGLAFNAAPGPVTAETLRRGLSGGFAPALSVQIGSLVGDVSWAVLGLAGAGAALSIPMLRVPLEGAGGALLLWLAWSAWRAARETGGFQPGRGCNVAARSAFATGAALSLSNPQNIAFWVALVAPLAALGVTDLWTAEAALFLGGFAASCVVWCFVAAGAVTWARAALTPPLHRVLNLGCAAALGAFGLLALWGAARGAAGG